MGALVVGSGGGSVGAAVVSLTKCVTSLDVP